MAFDFLGTFEREEFDKLINFVNAEVLQNKRRISALAIERDRVNTLKDKYVLAEQRLLDQTLLDTNQPAGDTTLRDKAVSEIYKIDPDAPRGDDQQEIALKEEREAGALTPQQRADLADLNLSELADEGVTQVVFDAPTAIIVEKIKRFVRPTIRVKRDNIQYAIMKLRDQQDLINKEIIDIKDREDELASLLEQINSMILSEDLPGATESAQESDLTGIIS